MDRALFVMIGGFLGAGKTTAIRRIARRLIDAGSRVGLITNDAGHGLVDTAVLDADGFAVEEIGGGCFCCRFDSLVEASKRLTASSRPDVFIAEPVGSCTDLVAAVAFPLRRIYGDAYRVAPLSVLVDPIRAERILDLEPGPTFSRKVLYVYAHQLREADTIVINKCDLIGPERQERLESTLRRAFPRAEVRRVSARDGTGLLGWVDAIAGSGSAATSAPDIDYERYAEGEALLGWLNASVSIRTDPEGVGDDLLRAVASGIRARLGRVEIAHLKMTLEPDERAGDIGVLSLVRTEGEPEISHSLREPLTSGELLVNLRAEADPDVLRRSVTEAIAACGWQAEIRQVDSFRPAKPRPTYRMARA